MKPADSPREPTLYLLSFTEGTWELAVPRGSKGKLHKVKCWPREADAVAGSIDIAQADKHGASLTIVTVRNFRRYSRSFNFPPHG